MALMNGWLPVWLFSCGMMEIFSPNYPKGKTTLVNTRRAPYCYSLMFSLETSKMACIVYYTRDINKFYNNRRSFFFCLKMFLSYPGYSDFVCIVIFRAQTSLPSAQITAGIYKHQQNLKLPRKRKKTKMIFWL